MKRRTKTRETYTVSVGGATGPFHDLVRPVRRSASSTVRFSSDSPRPFFGGRPAGALADE
ncbi:MAG: hypothetical protein ACLFRG_20105 [Desulfococcaceae bacterium]